MKAFVTAVLLFAFTACSAVGAETATKSAPRPNASKPLPVAPPPPPMPDEGGACPADVRQCPDGSFVSRSPTNGCAFDSCPGASTP